MMLTKNVLYYGKEEALPERVPLRAGPLSLVFEGGDLRYIRLGETEILRRVYVAVRDANWGTAPAVIWNLRINRSARGFSINYDARHRQREIDFRWTATIAGDDTGTITFIMDGKALSTFRRNRIGFCVHYPVRECAGRPVKVEKADGSVEQGLFPRFIAPHQPFLDMRAVSHEVLPGLTAQVRFSGEIFEMENHRNWTDGNYKIYGTPLRLPFPVEVKAGTVISQSVRLSLSGKAPQAAGPGEEDGVMFSVHSDRRAPLPSIGLGAASHAGRLTAKQLSRLQALNLAHVRVDLVLWKADYHPVLSQAASEAESLGVPLEIALTLSDTAESELGDLVARLQAVKPRVARFLVFHAKEKSTGAPWVLLARKLLAAFDPAARIVAGTNAYFTELNRGRPDPGIVDGACFSINPQVHAFDNESLVENLAAQAEVIESARQFLGAAPIIVTPVTFKRRFNPDATGPEPPPAAGELPPQVDPRQMSLFGAGWTAGSLKYIAEAGAASVTYYETTGWRGVMETEKGSPLPERFSSFPDAAFPLYHVLADVGEFAGGEAIRSASSRPLQVDGLVLRKGNRTRILLANFGLQERRVRISATELGGSVRVKELDESNAEAAMKFPEEYRRGAGRAVQIAGRWLEIALKPFAVARVDAGSD